MEIDFEKFEDYLSKKDKKNPFYRPLTSLPAQRPRNFSDYQTKDQCIFRRPQKIGYTVRLQSHHRKTRSQVRSSSIYDPSYFQDKSIKLKMANDIGMKYLQVRKPISNQSFYMKNLLTEKLKNIFQRDENNQNVKKYQKKKLKVVKGKTNPYKTKLIAGVACNETCQNIPEKSTINVAVIGTRLL